MSLSITIELSDTDLDHFQTVLKRTTDAAVGKSAAEITEAAMKLLGSAKTDNVPEFIASRLSKLKALIDMVHDEGWNMSAEDKARVLSALSYFAEEQDVIPDDVPVVGYLDDAIMIELCVRELKHELDAFIDFCDFRSNEAANRGLDIATVGRQDWLDGRRLELHERMQRRRERDGYTNSFGGRGLFRFG